MGFRHRPVHSAFIVQAIRHESAPAAQGRARQTARRQETTTPMNLKHLGFAAALAALALVPAASAHDANDPWGPDVTVVVDNNVCTFPFDLQDTLGPAFDLDANVHAEGCTQTVTYDGDNVEARCAPRSTPVFLEPRVTLYSDCDLDVVY